MPQPKSMTAGYSSRCLKCPTQIKPGDAIVYQRGVGSWHQTCPEQPATAPAGAGSITVFCGFDHRPSPSVHVGRVFRDREQVLVCIGIASRFIDEDGLSFGLGNDSGWLATLTCRLATDEERAGLETREAAGAAEREEAKRIATERRALADLFRAGESPKGKHRLEGEEIPIDTRSRAYGGGSWFVIEPAEVPVPTETEVEAAQTAAAPLMAMGAAYDAALVWQHVDPTPMPWKALYDALRGESLDLVPEIGRALVQTYLDARTRSDAAMPPGGWGPIERALEQFEERQRRVRMGRQIWHVQNNGGDGDCWAWNNIVTGGAGAIGHCLPWTAEIEARVRAVAERSEPARAAA